jgi:hypothetical protein
VHSQKQQQSKGEEVMGDRGNIIIKQKREEGQISFYTHWSGSDLPRIVANALDRGRSRWNDEDYLNRIIFCELLEGDLEGTTGFGIGISAAADANTIVIVDHKRGWIVYNGTEYSFDDFVTISKLGRRVQL